MSEKRRHLPVELLEPEEIGRLIDTCSRRAPTGVRNASLVTLLYRTGMRISEALALMPRDFDLRARTVVVHHGKGDKRRVLALDGAAYDAVRAWRAVREKMGLGNRAPFFCTLRGAHLQSAYIRQLLPRLARKAGILKRVHAHALRHTMAGELAREGMPMNLIQAILGHSDLRVTSRYLAHIQPTAVINAMACRDGFKWRGRGAGARQEGAGR